MPSYISLTREQADLFRRLIGLPDRKRDIAFLLAAGATNDDIAELCGIEPKTASEYTSTICGRLGIPRNRHNRREMLSRRMCGLARTIRMQTAGRMSHEQ